VRLTKICLLRPKIGITNEDSVMAERVTFFTSRKKIMVREGPPTAANTILGGVSFKRTKNTNEGELKILWNEPMYRAFK
jgi:hypothetical protein